MTQASNLTIYPHPGTVIRLWTGTYYVKEWSGSFVEGFVVSEKHNYKAWPVTYPVRAVQQGTLLSDEDTSTIKTILKLRGLI